jgi:hypothetical protein
MSRATNPSMKLVKGARCEEKVSNALSYRNFWERTLPAGLYRPLSSLRRTVSEKKSGFSPLSERPERRAPSSMQKDCNAERNSETDPFTVICTFPITHCSLSGDQSGSQTASLYRLLKRMSTSNMDRTQMRVYPKIVGGTVIARSPSTLRRGSGQARLRINSATKQSRLAKSGDCFAPSGRSQ